MSQPANDDYSQHLSNDEASYHNEVSDSGTTTNKPKQQQQQLTPITTSISNIKLPILKKEEYDIWAIEMEHYLEYIDNDVWKSGLLMISRVVQGAYDSNEATVDDYEQQQDDMDNMSRSRHGMKEAAVGLDTFEGLWAECVLYRSSYLDVN
ncbi:hypothetical protein Tco_0509313 [Tanacetum coccineum]